jgi:hypothetical protein
MKSTEIVVWEDGLKNYAERPDNLAAYVMWLHGILAEIPEPYREFAKVDIAPVWCPARRGSVMLDYRIFYRRPETPEEKAMRLEMERIKAIEDEIHRAGDVGSVLVFVTLPRRHRVKIK